MNVAVSLSGFLVSVCVFVIAVSPVDARFAYPNATSYVDLSGVLQPLDGEAKFPDATLIFLINADRGVSLLVISRKFVGMIKRRLVCPSSSGRPYVSTAQPRFSNCSNNLAF